MVHDTETYQSFCGGGGAPAPRASDNVTKLLLLSCDLDGNIFYLFVRVAVPALIPYLFHGWQAPVMASRRLYLLHVRFALLFGKTQLTRSTLAEVYVGNPKHENQILRVPSRFC